jgi:hypothetical protein
MAIAMTTRNGTTSNRVNLYSAVRYSTDRVVSKLFYRKVRVSQPSDRRPHMNLLPADIAMANGEEVDVVSHHNSPSTNRRTTAVIQHSARLHIH